MEGQMRIRIYQLLGIHGRYSAVDIAVSPAVRPALSLNRSDNPAVPKKKQGAPIV